MDKRKKAWARYIHCRTDQRLRDFQIIRNLTNRKIQEAQLTMERKIIEEVKYNPKSFWKYIQSKTKSKSPVGNVLDRNGNLTANHLETAEVLNQYFASVFNRDNSVITRECPLDLVLEDCPIGVNDIVKHLDNLKINRATGPDEMIARIIKEVRKEIVTPIHKLFCLSRY